MACTLSGPADENSNLTHVGLFTIKGGSDITVITSEIRSFFECMDLDKNNRHVHDRLGITAQEASSCTCPERSAFLRTAFLHKLLSEICDESSRVPFSSR